MKTAYELALDEFRDAAASVRLTFAAVSEAREIQILADRKYDDASNLHVAAQSRFDRADAHLQAARIEAPTPADIDTTRMPSPFGKPFNQMFAEPVTSCAAEAIEGYRGALDALTRADTPTLNGQPATPSSPDIGFQGLQPGEQG